MRCKSAFISFLALTAIGCFLFALTVSVSAQPDPKKTDRVKSFGTSIAPPAKAPANAAEAAKKSEDDDEIISVKTDLVVSDVLVSNQQGNLIVGLKKEDFVITEDDAPQQVELFSFGENANLPRSVVLIIDYSGSQLPFIENSIAAAKLLVDKLAPQDKMAIVTDDVELLIDFTKDKTLLKQELEALRKKALTKKKGSSLQYTALVTTLNKMFSEADVRPVVIMQSDGDELYSLASSNLDEEATDDSLSLNPVTNSMGQKTFGFREIFWMVKKSRATIYTIVPGYGIINLAPEERTARMKIAYNSYLEASFDAAGVKERDTAEKLATFTDTTFQQQLALAKIAIVSGGYTDYLEKPEDAESVYSNMFTIINNRYVIGYYPANQERNGKARTVKIEVRGHPEYNVLGRKTYFPLE